MSFTFEARTLLELGKELISTDEVAIYELIKNSIDAGSKKVTLSVTSRLTATNFREVKRRIEEKQGTPKDVLTYLRGRFDVEDVDTRALTEALEGVTKQSDFLATLEQHYSGLNSITVKDTGEGMSLKDLTDVFLRIGTRRRREQNDTGETKLGDKGIGRLSAMRLGERLCVKTTRSGEKRWNLLEIDWRDFSHAEEKLVEEIKIAPRRGAKKSDPDESGTIIEIEDINADWHWKRFNDLLEGRIARLIDPFEPGRANKLIHAEHNGRRALIPSIPTKLLSAAHATCAATLSFESISSDKIDDADDAIHPVITGEIHYGPSSSTIDARGAEVRSVSKNVRKKRTKRGHAQFEQTPISLAVLKDLGGFKVELYWYNRRIVEAISELTSKPFDTKREIAKWSGGPMLYRHGFRVLPYGDPEDDWLSLDKVAFGVSGFKLNRQQVIGRVLIDTPHKFLSEQTNREGLIQSEVAEALVRLVSWIVHTEFRNFINEIDEMEALQKRQDELENNQIVRAATALEKVVAKLEEMLPSGHDDQIAAVRKRATKLQNEALKVLDGLGDLKRQSADDREKFVYLAGIGLMTEFIFHELERSVSSTMNALDDKDAARNIGSLQEQLKTLHKRVAAFDELTGEKRQTKTEFDLPDLVRELIGNHSAEFKRHGITPQLNLPDGAFRIKAVKGMVIQIIENLLVNSAYWLKQQREYEDDFDPVISINVDQEARTLTVTDNGPGVPEGRIERIFQPFVTTKPSDMGKGLGLYISRDMAEYHDWTLKVGGDQGDIRPRRYNSFVLEMPA